jgi:hypothetical protein
MLSCREKLGLTLSHEGLRVVVDACGVDVSCWFCPTSFHRECLLKPLQRPLHVRYSLPAGGSVNRPDPNRISQARCLPLPV